MQKELIFDLGNASEHKNNIDYILDSIFEISKLKTEKIITVKFQMWNPGNPHIDKRLEPTEPDVFDTAFNACKSLGLKCTSSVSDTISLKFLENYDIDFVKIACIPELYFLADKTQKKCYISVPSYAHAAKVRNDGNLPLYCVRKYPAPALDYIKLIQEAEEFDIVDPAAFGLSDHTVDFGIYNKYQPSIYEIHVCLKKNKNDPYGNEFVHEIKDLGSIL